MENRVKHEQRNAGYEIIDTTQHPEYVLIRARMSDGDIIKMRYMGYTIEQALQSFNNNFITIKNFK